MHLGMPEYHKQFLGHCDLDLWPRFQELLCPEHISYIIWCSNPKFGVVIPLGMAEWCIPFWVTLTLTLTSGLISSFFVLYYSYLSSNVSYTRPIPLGAFVTCLWHFLLVLKKYYLYKILISRVYKLHITESRLSISPTLQCVNNGQFIDLSALFYSICLALITMHIKSEITVWWQKLNCRVCCWCWSFRLRIHVIIWALTRQNLSSGFPTKWASNQPAQLQRLDRKLKFCSKQVQIWYFSKSE